MPLKILANKCSILPLFVKACYSFWSFIVLLVLFVVHLYWQKGLVIVLTTSDWERHFNIAKLCVGDGRFVIYLSSVISRPRKESGLYYLYMHSALLSSLVRPLCIMDSSISLILGEKWNSKFLFSFVSKLRNTIVVDTCDIIVGDMLSNDQPRNRDNQYWQTLLLKRSDWVIARDLRTPKSIDDVALKRIFIPDYICYIDYLSSIALRAKRLRPPNKQPHFCYVGNLSPNIGDITSFHWSVSNELSYVNGTLEVYNSYLENHLVLSAIIDSQNLKNIISYPPVHFSKLLHTIRNSSCTVGVCFTNSSSPLDLNLLNDYTAKAYNLFCPLKLQLYVNAGLFFVAQPGKYLQFILHRYKLGTCISDYDQLLPLISELEKNEDKSHNGLAYNFSWEKNAPRIRNLLNHALHS